MKPRSHSLNQVVCVTMTAIEVTPTSKVQMKATTWSERLATDICSAPLGLGLCLFENSGSRRWALEGLTDAEVHAPAALFGRAVDEQTFERIELIPEVHTDRTDWSQVAQPRADGVAHVTGIEVPRLGPDVSVIEKRNRTQLASHRHPHFRRAFEHRQAADRESEPAQRADFVPSPTADAGRSPEKQPLVERHVLIGVPLRRDRPKIEAVRKYQLVGERDVVAGLSLRLPVVVGAPHESAGRL